MDIHACKSSNICSYFPALKLVYQFWIGRMDKFLVRTPRVSSVKKCRSPVKKKLKQAKLESLKGVVVIEQIIATKQILKDTTQDADVLLARLTELSNKLPAVEVLKTTGIGRTVKALYKHDDARVAAAAQRVVQQWTDHIKYIKTRPELEVQVGAAAQAMRDKAKHFLTEAFRSQQISTDPIFSERVDAIEKAIFRLSNKRTGNIYRRTVRSLSTKMKYDSSLRELFSAKDADLTALLAPFVK